MSADKKAKAPVNATARSDVGYGKPPEGHRFQKGRSGNPKGRPKRAKAKQVDTGFGMNAVEEFLRIEAYRPVTIREGEKIIQLPAIQAVFRAMNVSAMKGNRFAQRTMAELVSNMEADHHRLRMEHFGTAIDYKRDWSEAIEVARKAGREEPNPIPHPDDILLNPNTGEVRILGPKTPEQRATYDQQIVRREQAQQEVSYFADQYRRARDPKRKAQWLKEWHFEQRIFDVINDLIGPRYRTTLADRSYREGASRAGDIAKKHGISW
jgi:hypothetical protein